MSVLSFSGKRGKIRLFLVEKKTNDQKKLKKKDEKVVVSILTQNGKTILLLRTLLPFFCPTNNPFILLRVS